MLVGCAGLKGGGNNGGNNGGGGTTPPPPPAPTFKTSVNHIVLMMQENRSFDEYFGQLNKYRASKGLSTEVDDLSKVNNVLLRGWDVPNDRPSDTPTQAPFKMVSSCIHDLSSSWDEAHSDMNLDNKNNPGDPPPMNGFAAMAGGFSAHNPTAGGTDTDGKRAMGYYESDQLTFYYWAATQFATSDRWFSAAPTRTQPNRMFFLAATSNGYAFPGDNNHPEINMAGVKNIFELLQNAGITWKVYVSDGISASDPTGSTYMDYFDAFTKAHTDHFVPATQFATDAANGTLPQVALIESGTESGRDEHPQNPVDKGANYVRDFVVALMNSPSWKDSVMFVTFDEGGGFYDHVPPMKTVSPDGKKPIALQPNEAQGDFDITGFRVPLMVISPFTKPGFVSHTPADFTALLKFVEKRFDLPNLNARDAFQPDMDAEYFDWTAPNLSSTNPPAQPSLPCTQDQLP
ncbi:MAG TPA: alkaline phosphatase family protein [Terriglobales bacterium]|nr:alkaline phosphatase family protein [Terriglobales bacterium]